MQGVCVQNFMMMYCEVSLPVPLDHAFTYGLPETLQHRVRPGCRLLVPFGARKLTGMVLALHSEAPDGPVKEALRLVDEEPVLNAELLSLGRWIAQYYCAPLGEVLRSMTPLSGEVRKTKLYSLTDAGRDTARQLLLGADEEDPALGMLRLLEARPLSASYLQKKLPNALAVIRSLEKKGFVAMEDLEAQRDPLRASATRLRASFLESAARRREADQARARAACLSRTAPGHAQPGAVGSYGEGRKPGRAFPRPPESDHLGAGSAHRRLHLGSSAADAQSASIGSVSADRSRTAQRAISYVSAPRRHGIRQDRGVSQVDRCGALLWAAALCCWCLKSR